MIEKYKSRGLKYLEVNLTMTPTNQGVKKFLDDLKFYLKQTIGESLLYNLNLINYEIEDNTHITLDNTRPELSYVGMPDVQNFYKSNVKPIIKPYDDIINLGSARGEVLGLMQEKERAEFYDFLISKSVNYKKIDLEYIAEEDNIIGDAENLKGLIADNSQDLVMAIELLEHSEHYWNILAEMNRICKINGHIFITVPSFNYPKHEYPVDLWRIGPETLSSYFSKPYYNLKKIETSGNEKTPWRTMIFAEKLANYDVEFTKRESGIYNYQTGLTIYP